MTSRKTSVRARGVDFSNANPLSITAVLGWRDRSSLIRKDPCPWVVFLRNVASICGSDMRAQFAMKVGVLPHRPDAKTRISRNAWRNQEGFQRTRFVYKHPRNCAS